MTKQDRTYLKELEKEVKSRLEDYLRIHGREVSNNGSFQCLMPQNHEHGDSDFSASMTRKADGTSIWFCQVCLHEMEMIWISRGLIPIKDVIVGDIVIDRYGNPATVTRTNSKRSVTLGLSTWSFRHDPLRLTPDHTCIYVTKEDAIDALTYVNPYNGRELKFTSFRKRNKRKHIEPQVTEGPASGIKVNDFMLFPVIKDENRIALSLDGKDVIRPYTKGPRNSRIEELPVNTKTAWLYGLYLAEGYTAPREAVFALGDHERYTLATKAADILNSEFSIAATIIEIPERHSCIVRASKVDLARLLEKWFGKLAHCKKIPYEVLYWPANIQKEFVRGYLDGDATADGYQATTVSQRIAYGIFATMIQCGMYASLGRKDSCVRKDGITRKETWHVGHRRREGLAGFYETIGENEYYWSRVLQIGKDSGKSRVIDIEIEDTESFVTKLGVVHNCQVGGTIYDLAHLAEGYVIHGSGFDRTTVELAEKLGIPIERDKLPEMKETGADPYSFLDINREIEAYLSSKGDGIKHLTSNMFGRKYTKEQAKEICKLVPIGCVDSHPFTEHMRKKFGGRIELLPYYDSRTSLIAPYVFTRDRLTISTRDRLGRPVAFSGRAKDILCDKKIPKEKRLAKYIHTKGFGGVRKGTLFLMNEARAEISKVRKVYTVEGQFDTISMHISGIKNCVGILGAGLSEEAIEKLIPFKIHTIVHIPDPDKAGVTAVKRMLASMAYYDMAIRIVALPDNMDPDELLRSGDKSFLGNEMDAVEFVIERDGEMNDETVSPEIRYKTMVEFVVSNCHQAVKYRGYAEMISSRVGYHNDDILSDLTNYSSSGALMSNKEKKIMRKVFDNANAGIMEKIIVMEDAVNKLREISVDYRKGAKNTWQDFMGLINGETSFPDILDSGFPRLDKVSDIECGSLTFVSGRPSNGKSSWLQYVTVDMIRRYPDLYVLYVSTDDNPLKPQAAFLSIITGLSKRLVRQYISEGSFMKQPEVSSCFDEIHDLYSNRMLLQGLDTCYSSANIRRKLEWIRTFHSGKLLTVIDAMNDLTDLARDDQRVGIENAIRGFKTMGVTYNSAMVTVSHTVKENSYSIGASRRPRLSDLKGSSYIEFAAKTVFLFYMDMHYNKSTTELRWRRQGITMGDAYPIVEVAAAKDKDNPAGDIIPLEFNPINGRFSEPPDHQYNHYMDIIEKGGEEDGGSAGGSKAGLGEDI